MAAFLHGPDGNGISFAGSAVGRIDLPNITQATLRSRTYCLMGRLTLARTYCLTSRTHWILFLSLTYEVLTTSQPDYLHNLISVQSRCRTHSSSAFILARPSVSPTALSHVSPYLWNQLPSSFRQPHSVHCPPGSPHPVHITSSQLPPFLSSPITSSAFHSRRKTHIFHKSFPS